MQQQINAVVTGFTCNVHFHILKLNMFKELKLVVTGDKVKDTGGLLR